MTIDRLTAPEGCFETLINGKPAYCHVVSSSRKRTVYISGQVARDPSGALVGIGDMEAQLRQVGENLKAALAGVGATLDDVIKTTTYVTDMEAFIAAVHVRGEFLGASLPASTTVEISRLADPRALIEIEAVAMLDE